MSFTIKKEDLLEPNKLEKDKDFAQKTYHNIKSIEESAKLLQGNLIGNDNQMQVTCNGIHYTSTIDNHPEKQPIVTGNASLLIRETDSNHMLYQIISIWNDKQAEQESLFIDVKFQEKSNDNKQSNLVGSIRYDYNPLSHDFTNIDCMGTKELEEFSTSINSENIHLSDVENKER